MRAAIETERISNIETVAPESGGGWSAGDHCRAVYTEDGAEYEAAVLSVEADAGGNRYARGAIQYIQ